MTDVIEAPSTRRAAASDGSTVLDRIEAAVARLHAPRELHAGPGIGALAVWAAAALMTIAVPDTSRYVVEGTRFIAVITVALPVAYAATWAYGRSGLPRSERVLGSLGGGTPWVIASGAWYLIWEWTTAKTGALVPPYFTPPQQLFAELWKDRVLLSQSFGNSLLLLAIGFTVGAVAGLITGLAMGWSRQATYWLHPVIQYIGPVPALAWVPIVFVVFPTAYAGAVFLIALSVWFPVAVLTRAGIRGVPRSYYDVAQTLGASNRFLIWRISLPAALPSIFTGLFMALSAAFVTLTVAENFGVNSGLGWYINWKKGWSAYPAMYAAIILMVVFCGGLLSILLAVRNRVLSWQKDLTRW